MLKERLKQIRLFFKFNQQQMADRLSIDVRKLRSYEYETKNYPVDFLILLVNVLNVNINWLLTGKGEMFLSTISESDNFRAKVEAILRENKLIR